MNYDNLLNPLLFWSGGVPSNGGEEKEEEEGEDGTRINREGREPRGDLPK